MKFQDKFYDIIDHNKCPSSEKSYEKHLLRKSNFHHSEPNYIAKKSWQSFRIYFLFPYQNTNICLKIADMYKNLNFLVAFINCNEFWRKKQRLKLYITAIFWKLFSQLLMLFECVYPWNEVTWKVGPWNVKYWKKRNHILHI